MESYVICLFAALVSVLLAILYDPPPVIARLVGTPQLPDVHRMTDVSAADSSTDGIEFVLPAIDDNSVSIIHGVAANSFSDIIPDEGMPLLNFIVTFSARILVLAVLQMPQLDIEANGIRDTAADLYTTHFASTGVIETSGPMTRERLQRLCHTTEPNQHARVATWTAALTYMVIQFFLKLDAEPEVRSAFSAIYDTPCREQYRTVMVRYLTAESNIFGNTRSHRDGAILRRQGRSWFWTIARRCAGCAVAASPVGELDLEAARSREPNQLLDPVSSNADSLGLIAGVIVAVVVRNLILDVDVGSGGLGMVRRKAAPPVM